jgi:hypothetical protein
MGWDFPQAAATTHIPEAYCFIKAPCSLKETGQEELLKHVPSNLFSSLGQQGKKSSTGKVYGTLENCRIFQYHRVLC